MIVLLLLPVVIATANNVLYDVKDGQQYFENFVRDHHKLYKTDEEKAMRYEIFVKNLDEINDLNRRNELATFGINQFTDLTLDEFVTQYGGSQQDCGSEEYTNVHPMLKEEGKLLDFPAHFDWRTKNVVSKVKGQGACQSSWAFAAVGNVESVYAIKTGEMLGLSVQQVLDCETYSLGCGGGCSSFALRYLKRLGAMPEESYPYEAETNICRYDHGRVIRVKDYTYIPPYNEELTAKLLPLLGPLIVDICPKTLKAYTGGILAGESCVVGGCLGHHVLLVGYGVENGLSYWVVKNSWNETWGEQGYFRMHRGVNCLNVVE